MCVCVFIVIVTVAATIMCLLYWNTELCLSGLIFQIHSLIHTLHVQLTNLFACQRDVCHAQTSDRYLVL